MELPNGVSRQPFEQNQSHGARCVRVSSIFFTKSKLTDSYDTFEQSIDCNCISITKSIL